MDAVDLIRTILRRWYVVCPILLLTGAGAWFAGESVSTDYEARSAMLLLGPSITASESGGEFVNPYRSAGTDATADALDFVADGSGTAVLMAESGFAGVAYDVRADNSILQISATADSAEKSVAAVLFLQEYLGSELEQRQDAVQAPTDQRLGFDVLAAPSMSTEIVEGVSRIRVAVIGAGGLLALVAAIVVDRLATRGSRREDAALDTQPAPRPQAEPDAGDRRRGADEVRGGSTPAAEAAARPVDERESSALDDELEFAERFGLHQPLSERRSAGRTAERASRRS